jgi:hypothetical protein
MDPGLPSEAFAEVDGAYDFDFDRVVLSSWRQNMTIDEIRIGSAWQNVTVAGPPDYGIWSTGFSTPVDGDENDDGIPNGIAYAIGAEAHESALHLIPTISGTTGSVSFAVEKTMRSDVWYEILASDELGSWDRVAYKDPVTGWSKDTFHPWNPFISVTSTSEGVVVLVSGAGLPARQFYRLSAIID